MFLPNCETPNNALTCKLTNPSSESTNKMDIENGNNSQESQKESNSDTEVNFPQKNKNKKLKPEQNERKNKKRVKQLPSLTNNKNFPGSRNDERTTSLLKLLNHSPLQFYTEFKASEKLNVVPEPEPLRKTITISSVMNGEGEQELRRSICLKEATTKNNLGKNPVVLNLCNSLECLKIAKTDQDSYRALELLKSTSRNACVVKELSSIFGMRLLGYTRTTLHEKLAEMYEVVFKNGSKIENDPRAKEVSRSLGKNPSDFFRARALEKRYNAETLQKSKVTKMLG